MGGVLLIGAVFVSSFIWARPGNRFVWLALFSMIYLGALGFVDDYLKVTKKKSEGISGRLKLVFQIALAAIHERFPQQSVARGASAFALRAVYQSACHR